MSPTVNALLINNASGSGEAFSPRLSAVKETECSCVEKPGFSLGAGACGWALGGGEVEARWSAPTVWLGLRKTLQPAPQLLRWDTGRVSHASLQPY